MTGQEQEQWRKEQPRACIRRGPRGGRMAIRGVWSQAGKTSGRPEDAVSLGLGADAECCGSLGSGEKILRGESTSWAEEGAIRVLILGVRCLTQGPDDGHHAPNPAPIRRLGSPHVRFISLAMPSPASLSAALSGCVAATCHIRANAELARISCNRHRLCFAWPASSPLLTGAASLLCSRPCRRTRSQRGLGRSSSLSCLATVARRRQLQG
jgi:hypothetical protein